MVGPGCNPIEEPFRMFLDGTPTRTQHKMMLQYGRVPATVICSSPSLDMYPNIFHMFEKKLSMGSIILRCDSTLGSFHSLAGCEGIESFQAKV